MLAEAASVTMLAPRPCDDYTMETLLCFSMLLRCVFDFQLHEFSFRATQSVISFLNSFAAGVSSLLPSMPLVYRRAVQTQLDETIFSLVESMLSLPPACVTLVLPLLYTAPVQFVDKVCADRIFMRLFFGCEVDAPLLSSE